MINTSQDLTFFRLMIDIIRPDFDTGPWIAGGYPMRIYSNMDLSISDIDVFFKNEEQYQLTEQRFIDAVSYEEECVFHAVDDLFSFKQNKMKVIKTKPYNLFSSTNANTYTDEKGNKIQFIHNVFHENLESVFEHFDINLCKIATDGKDFIASESTYHDIENKILNMVKIKNTSMKRFTKYVGYGFTPSKETIKKLHANAGVIAWDYRSITDEEYS